MKVAYKQGTGNEILRHLSFDFDCGEPIVVNEYSDLLKEDKKLVFLMDTKNAQKNFYEARIIDNYQWHWDSIIVVGENKANIPLHEQIQSIPSSKYDIVYIPLLTERVLHAEAALAIALHHQQIVSSNCG